YYVGVVLLIFGLGVLAPLSARQSAIMVGGLFLGFVTLPMWHADSNGWTSSFALRVFFLGAASFCGGMSCAYLDRLRCSYFVQRKEIERARDELAELDAAKSRFTANIHHELRT